MSELIDFLQSQAVIISNGATVAGTPKMRTMTTSQSFIVPPNVTLIKALIMGGGGGGGSGYSSSRQVGGGGGAGGYIETNLLVSQGETLTVTIGAGGIGSDNNVGYGTGTKGGTTELTSSVSGITLRSEGGGAGTGSTSTVPLPIECRGASNGGRGVSESSSSPSFYVIKHFAAAGGSAANATTAGRAFGPQTYDTSKVDVVSDITALGSNSYGEYGSSVETTVACSPFITSHGYCSGGGGGVITPAAYKLRWSANLTNDPFIGATNDSIPPAQVQFGCGGNGGNRNFSGGKSSRDGVQGAVILYWYE